MARKQTRRLVPRGWGWIDERNGTFQARWPERREDGRTWYPSESFGTYDEAYDHLYEMDRKRRAGTPAPPRDRTIEHLVLDWLKRGKHRWKPSTYASYETIARRHLLPEIGRLPIRSVTTVQLQAWIDELVERGYSPKTMQNFRMVLTGAFNEAVRLRLLSDSPARGLILPAVEEIEPAAWSIEDARTVLAHLADDPFWHAVYLFALTTGARPGELRALQWGDFGRDLATVRIRRSMTRDEHYSPVIGTSTKNKTKRTVAVPELTRVALRRWKAEQNRRRLASRSWNDLDLVFSRRDGNFLPYTNWQREHRRIIEATGVATITIHGLRHTNATLDMEADVHPKIVQDRLGHKSIEQTMKYSHASARLQRVSSEELAERLLG